MKRIISSSVRGVLRVGRTFFSRVDSKPAPLSPVKPTLVAGIWLHIARLLMTLCMLAFTAAASGQDVGGRHNLQNAGFLTATYFVELQQGSELSRLASGLRGGGFELSGGAAVKFAKWYKTDWVDTRLGWMTLVTPNVGILFGFSTGERGEKYEIEPSFRLGLLAQRAIGKHTKLSFRVSTTLGGRLREKACTADYGEIGGVRKVNCRLAASILTPEDTLKYLMNRRPNDRHQVAVMFTRRF